MILRQAQYHTECHRRMTYQRSIHLQLKAWSLLECCYKRSLQQHEFLEYFFECCYKRSLQQHEFLEYFFECCYKRSRLRIKAAVKKTAPPKQGVRNGLGALIEQRPLRHFIFPFFQLSSSELKLNQAKRVPPRSTQN